MKVVKVNKARETIMSLRTCGVYRGSFYKYNPDSFNILNTILNNKGQISGDLYNLPTKYLYNRDNEFIGYLSKYLKNHSTIYDLIRLNINFDYDSVVANIAKIVMELERLGLNYYDLHDENFMIDSNGDFKTIDIEGAEILVDDKGKMFTINNFWDLVFEIYLFRFNPDHPARLNTFYFFDDITTYFSDEFVEYIDGVIRDDMDVLSVDINKYLMEFKDSEKINELSLRLRIEGERHGY